jgi:hypothetical protein
MKKHEVKHLYSFRGYAWKLAMRFSGRRTKGMAALKSPILNDNNA